MATFMIPGIYLAASHPLQFNNNPSSLEGYATPMMDPEPNSRIVNVEFVETGIPDYFFC